MTRLAYVNCSAGVAGDMLIGALVDAGADPERVASAVAAVGIDGYALAFERTQRAGVAATWANVVTDDHVHHRPIAAIRELLDGADLAGPVRSAAQRIFTVLAESESAVHGVEADDVALHEVGALDTVIDVVGVAAALDALAIGGLVCSPIAVGHGHVQAAHGRLPNPPPAVTWMAASRNVPLVGVDTGMELSTPTGVAVVVALADRFGPLPAMTVEAVGYGAGTADTPGRPNVVQIVVGTSEVVDAPRPGQAVVELETNVDDVTGEVLAHTIGALMTAGAHDAWATPIVMKKGRPAHTVHALADPAQLDHLVAILRAETGSLGVRASTVERWPQRRIEVTIDLDGHPVRVKLADGRAKPEHDDAAAAASALGRPLRDVLRETESIALDRPPTS